MLLLLHSATLAMAVGPFAHWVAVRPYFHQEKPTTELASMQLAIDATLVELPEHVDDVAKPERHRNILKPSAGIGLSVPVCVLGCQYARSTWKKQP